MKIRYKKYLGPCRLASVRCDCGLPAAFNQSSKNNANHGSYFFGCANWNREGRCRFFWWSHEYRGIYDFNRPSIAQAQAPSPPSKLPGTLDELQRLLECVICRSETRSCLIRPCNHLCLCRKCAREIRYQCPICRQSIESIEPVFMV
jgi:hypothetical protein